MTAAALSLATQSAVLVASLLVVLFWFWSAVRLDCYRQRMFAIRDDLFDYASSGKISFEHPAYRLLRQSMNGFIRYGHQLSFYQFVLTALAWKMNDDRASFSWEKKWHESLKSLDEGTRLELLAFYDRAMTQVSERIVLGSPFLILSLLISLIVVLIHFGWKSTRDTMAAALSATVAHSLDKRILEEEAARAAA